MVQMNKTNMCPLKTVSFNISLFAIKFHIKHYCVDTESNNLAATTAAQSFKHVLSILTLN